MKRLQIRAVEDMMAAPEDEWFEVPRGVALEVVEETFRLVDGRLLVRIPPRVARQFALRRGESLRARISKGTLILERRRPKNAP